MSSRAIYLCGWGLCLLSVVLVTAQIRAGYATLVIAGALLVTAAKLNRGAGHLIPGETSTPNPRFRRLGLVVVGAGWILIGIWGLAS